MLAKYVGESNEHLTHGKIYESLSTPVTSIWNILRDDNNELTKVHNSEIIEIIEQ